MTRRLRATGYACWIGSGSRGDSLALACDRRRLRYIEADRQELRAGIAALRQEFKADLRELELRMTIKLGAMCAGSVALVAALVKLL